MAASQHSGELTLSDETGFQRDILAILSQTGQTHGLGVKEVLEEQYGTEIHHGRLYPNLDTLVDRGLVAKGVVDRRTNSYELTDRGERELAMDLEWRTGASEA